VGGGVFCVGGGGHADDVRAKVVELHSVRESKQDDRKLWVNERLELKAESQDDRWVWTNALQREMGREGAQEQAQEQEQEEEQEQLPRTSTREDVVRTLEALGGVSGEVEGYVLGLAGELEREYDRRRVLLDIVYRLEDEKRELETRLAVEGMKLDEEGTTAGDEDESEEGHGVSRGSESGSDEEFFDAVECGGGMERASSLGDLARFDALCRVRGEGQVEVSRPVSAESVGPAGPAGPVATRPSHRRERLPTPQQQEKAISLWSLIKEMVGKDLTRVCLPVYFNEPLSALELTAEDLEYSELLDVAAAHPPGSMERLVHVMAFAISPYSSTEGRTSKPFNPLLGETYELCSEDKGFRFVAEKVSHHPTIIAAHAVGGWRDGGAASGNIKWTYQGDAEIKSKFWGRSIELKPEGVLTLDFEDGDSYLWNKVTTSINNLIIGKIYVDHGGLMKIRRRGSTTVAKVRFKETKLLFDRDPRRVEGHVEVDGERLSYPTLEGHWSDSIDVTWEGGRRERVWTKNPMPEHRNANRYNMTRYAIGLNEITPEMEGKLAPTDSRLRPDQRLTELGMWEEANEEKQRLEHKQRAARKAAEEGVPLKPRWFSVKQDKVHLTKQLSGHHISSDELSFTFTGEYWGARARGEFEGVRDIFGE